MLNISFNPHTPIFNKTTRSKSNAKVSFGCCRVDTFQKCAAEIVDEAKLTQMLNNPNFRVTKSFLDGLSKKAYEFCLNFAKGTEKTFEKLFPESRGAVLHEDVREIAKYSDGLYKGLEKIAKQKNLNMQDILVVGIGQSPDAIVKALEYKGIRTGYCPLSSLRMFNHTGKYVNDETIKNGFSKWKDFGFDLDSLFKEKMIIFIDHKETGATLEGFKNIIHKIQSTMGHAENNGREPAKLMFKPIKDLHRSVNHGVFEAINARETEDSLFHSSYFKTLYSPLFKLPLDKITSIDELSKLNPEANVRFNKFAILLYDEMKNPTTTQGYFSRSRLEYQRKSRLSAVVSDLFNSEN